MAQYIRNQNPGNTYFFTVCIADLHSDLLVTRVQLLRDAVKLCQKTTPVYDQCSRNLARHGAYDLDVTSTGCGLLGPVAANQIHILTPCADAGPAPVRSLQDKGYVA
jgi:hypothetical protein